MKCDCFQSIYNLSYLTNTYHLYLPVLKTKLNFKSLVKDWCTLNMKHLESYSIRHSQWNDEVLGCRTVRHRERYDEVYGFLFFLILCFIFWGYLRITILSKSLRFLFWKWLIIRINSAQHFYNNRLFFNRISFFGIQGEIEERKTFSISGFLGSNELFFSSST